MRSKAKGATRAIVKSMGKERTTKEEIASRKTKEKTNKPGRRPKENKKEPAVKMPPRLGEIEEKKNRARKCREKPRRRQQRKRNTDRIKAKRKRRKSKGQIIDAINDAGRGQRKRNEEIGNN